MIVKTMIVIWVDFLRQAIESLSMNCNIPRLTPHAKQHLNQSKVVAPCQQWRIIKASGTTLRDYLQGQITQDINLLSSEQAIHACLLEPQGKAISDIYIIECTPHELLILSPSTTAEATVNRLRRFALGHQLRIGIIDTLSCLYISTPSLLPETNMDAPAAHYLACSHNPEHTQQVIRIFNEPSLCLWIAPTEISNQQATNLNENEIEAYRILQGHITFQNEWDSSIHPLNANLIEFQGVSFNKGCYVGQEVTARMQWRGGIKKRFYRVRLNAIPATIPCSIHSTIKIGELRSAALDEQHHCFGIAWLPIETAESSTALTLQCGTTVEILEPCHA